VSLLCTAQFLVVANLTLVITTLPSMRPDLGFGGADVQWVITAYTLTFAGSLLPLGQLADLHGNRTVVIAGLGVFATGSLGCGLAPNAAVLLAGRAAQGLGAAAVVASGLATLIDAVPAGRARNRVLGVWSAAQAGGGAAGWLLGGVATQLVGWRWVFLGNVPLAGLGLTLAPMLLPWGAARVGRRLDLLGTSLVAAGLFLVVYGLTVFPRPLPAAVALAAGCLALGGFVLVERRVLDPVLPLSVLRERPLMTGSGVLAMINGLITPVLLLVALHLQQVAGVGAALAGMLLVPFNLSVVAGSLLAARRPGRSTMALAFGATTVGAAIPLLLPARGSFWVPLLAAFILLGVGGGAAAVTASAIGTSGTGVRGLTIGVLNTATELGAALGTAVLLTVAARGGDRVAYVAVAVGAAFALFVRLVTLGRHADHGEDTDSAE
jgi:MFS family permease